METVAVVSYLLTFQSMAGHSSHEQYSSYCLEQYLLEWEESLLQDFKAGALRYRPFVPRTS